MSDRGYTTADKIQTYLGQTITDSLSPFILSAQQFIETYCDRVFKAEDAASARYFDGNGKSSLRIDDCIEVTIVEIGLDSYGGSFLTPVLGNFKFLPNNAVALGVPITEIVSKDYVFTLGLQNQRVTAKWGNSDCIPDDIKFMATVLASGMYLNAKGAGSISSESIGQYTVSYKNDNNWSDFKAIYSVLDRYRRLSI